MIRKGLAVSAGLVVLMLGLSFWAMGHVPPGGQYAVHWNIHGEADRFGGRNEILWLMPALSIALAALFSILPAIDPRGRNLLRSSLAYLVIWIGAFMVLAFAHAMMVLNAAGVLALADVTGGPGLLRAVAVLVGLFVAALGAVMGKIRPNWFMGVRTPWTLSSDLSWDKTHRLAGYLFVATGLASVLAALVLVPQWALIILTGGLGASAIIAVLYSWQVWKTDPARETLVPEDVPEEASE